MKEIRKAIIDRQNEISDNIAKGIYQNNSKNKKLGRVGGKYGKNIGSDLKGISLANVEDRTKEILSKVNSTEVGGIVMVVDMYNGFSGAVKITSNENGKLTGVRLIDLANGSPEWKSRNNRQTFTRDNVTSFAARGSHQAKENLGNYIKRFETNDDFEDTKAPESAAKEIAAKEIAAKEIAADKKVSDHNDTKEFGDMRRSEDGHMAEYKKLKGQANKMRYAYAKGKIDKLDNKLLSKLENQAIRHMTQATDIANAAHKKNKK